MENINLLKKITELEFEVFRLRNENNVVKKLQAENNQLRNTVLLLQNAIKAYQPNKN